MSGNRAAAEFAAKHENMKKLAAKNTINSAHLPWKFGPGLQRGTQLLRRLRSAVDGISGRALTYEEWFVATGVPRSTLCDWLKGDGEPSPEALLRMFELLPTALRHQILDEPAFLRCRPVVDHPRLSHNPNMVSRMKTIISKTEGVTLVQSELEAMTTFVVSALAHSCWALSGTRREVLGLDSHAPDWFVPVPKVTYFDNVLHRQTLQVEFEKALPRISNSKGALVVLNGGWAQLPGFFESTRALAQHSHVIVGDSVRPRSAQPTTLPMHVLTLSADRTVPDRIQVEIHAM